jgi:hypothetical protein
LTGQGFVETAKQGIGVGGKVNLNAVIWRILPQTFEQKTQVVVEQGLMLTLQGQAQSFACDGVGAPIDAHAVC